MNKEILDALNALSQGREVVYTPLKEGQYKCKIEKIGINDEPNEVLKNLGFYTKEQPELKNNDYIRLDLITAEGKRINRNVFPENENTVASNIKRQLGIEDDIPFMQVITFALANQSELDMWVWYNQSYKNVDFYDAISSRNEQNEEQASALEALNRL